MTEFELNIPIEPGSADDQCLANYRARIAEYNRLRESFDEVQARWYKAGLDSHGRYPACLSMLSSFYVAANDLQRIIQTEEIEERRVEAVDLEKSVHESIGRLFDRLHGSTSAERAQEEQLLRLALSDAENLDLKRLEAREARPEQLRQFEEGWRANSLIDIDVASIAPAAAGLFQYLYSKDWYPKYNLPSRIAKYEEDKELEVLYPSDLPAYAAEVISLVKQQLKELQNVAEQRFPDDEEKKKRWRQVMKDMLKQFEQHVAKDLGKLPEQTDGASSQEITTIADLCLPPFTPVDLDKLLTHLNVIQNGKWHLGELPSRKAAPKSAFPAVYRVLSNEQNKLLKRVPSDKVWADLFRKEFEVSFKDRIANYNEAMLDDRPEFINYLADAQTWVDTWKQRLMSV